LQLESLESSVPGIAHDDLREVFEPFVVRHCDGDDAQWDAEMKRRHRKLAKQSLRRLIGWRGQGARDENTVVAEYQRAWDRIDYGIYDVARRPTEGTPWLWRGSRMFASETGGARIRQLLLARVIEQLAPRRVLEVGCGNGINLIMLSGLFPDIAFTGIELTQAGHEAALSLQRQPELPASLQMFSPLPVADPEAYQRIEFLRGNAANLPFPDGSFDLVYSVLAVEQMEQIRAQALGEIARTSEHHVAMIEPFREVNRGFWTRLNVYRRDYFRGSIDELSHYGLRPVLATADFPQEAFLKACMVVAEKIR
jgi:SAM-dependent methyltransferase